MKCRSHQDTTIFHLQNANDDKDGYLLSQKLNVCHMLRLKMTPHLNEQRSSWDPIATKW